MNREYTVAHVLATTCNARRNCLASNNSEWLEKHSETIRWITDQFLPSGSGIDCGTKLDVDKSGPNGLVMTCEFHHMNEGGMYDGWTSHTIRVKPTLTGLDISVSGKNRDDIKDYLCDLYYMAMNEVCHIVNYESGQNGLGWRTPDGVWHPKDDE